LLSTSFSVHSRKKELMPPLELLFVYRLSKCITLALLAG